MFQESPVVQRRLAVLSCQVKKSEASKKTYEVATEKLLTFLEVRSTTTLSQDSVNKRFLLLWVP